MRVSLLVLLLVLLVSGPASAEDPNLVDTQQGITYTKPAGWVVAPAKKGAVSALRAAGDAKSQIEFRFAKVTGEPTVSYFTTFHASLVKAKLVRVKDGEPKSYGVLKGKLTEYSIGKGPTQKALFVYEFTTDQGAWLVVGMFDGGRRDEDLLAYEKMLGAVVAK